MSSEATRLLPPIGAPGFVGRELELAELERALAEPPAVVLIEGEAGIGKSRLLRELLGPDGEVGRAALLAVCPPFRESLTLGPVVDAILRARTAPPGCGCPRWAARCARCSRNGPPTCRPRRNRSTTPGPPGTGCSGRWPS